MLNDDLLRVIMAHIRAGRIADAIDNIALLDGDKLIVLGRQARYALTCQNSTLAMVLLDKGFGVSNESKG